MTECNFCSSPAVATLISDDANEPDVLFCSLCLASYDLDASELADRIAEERKRLGN